MPTFIFNWSDWLLANELDHLTENGKHNLERMHAAAMLMQNLINNLLTYSRIVATEKKYEAVDLQQLIDEIKEEFKEEFRKKQAIIEVETDCTINVIRFLFRQLLKNLVGNALKFSRPGIPPYIFIKSKNISAVESGRRRRPAA